MKRQSLFLLIMVGISTQGCFRLGLLGHDLISSSSSSNLQLAAPQVSQISVANGTVTIQGSGLQSIGSAAIEGVGPLSIVSQSGSQLVAMISSSTTLALNTLYNLVVTSADASQSTTISFGVTGASAGAVLFASSGGVVSSDSSNLFWDETNKRLGVGTSSPANLLDVSGGVLRVVGVGGTTSMLQVQSTSNTNADYVMARFTTGDGANFDFGKNNTGNQGGSIFFWTSAAVPMKFGVNGGLHMSVDTTGGVLVGNSYANQTGVAPAEGLAVSGWVGIGTTTPQAPLDVAGLMRLPQQPSGSIPLCTANTPGAIAITFSFVGCVCNGASWVKLADGTTACSF